MAQWVGRRTGARIDAAAMIADTECRAMRLYFVRHGESEANRLGEFSNRGLKHGLTARGEEQARVLARTLKDVSAARLFSSPLLRAVQTAQIVSEELAIPYEVTDALQEYDCGILEGKADAASWELYEGVSAAWLRDKDWEARIEGGESFVDIRRRFVPFIERLVEESTGSSQTLIAVGHGGLYRCMLPLVLGNIDFDFAQHHPIGNTDCIIAEPGPEGLTCLSWGQMAVSTDTSALR
jgi:broad specificity phosphatase PhoE